MAWTGLPKYDSTIKTERREVESRVCRAVYAHLRAKYGAEAEAATTAKSLFTADVWAKARAASKKSHDLGDLGQSWSGQISAARAIFREALAGAPDRPSKLRELRDRHDLAFRDLLLKVYAMVENR
jgi:hypothetical protein